MKRRESAKLLHFPALGTEKSISCGFETAPAFNLCYMHFIHLICWAASSWVDRKFRLACVNNMSTLEFVNIELLPLYIPSKEPSQNPAWAVRAWRIRLYVGSGIICHALVPILRHALPGPKFEDFSTLLRAQCTVYTVPYMYTACTRGFKTIHEIFQRKEMFKEAQAVPSPSPIGFIRAGCGSRARIVCKIWLQRP
jgi:hypothetical protein